ncbi:MAG: hypothetical protein GX605_13155 [Chloroflexi bacterium]|nr:hypothetical protein [Chloroflexota bacterium]
MRDSEDDTGLVPTPGPYWNSPDLWVRNADDGESEHQPPLAGQANYLFARVHNRGPATAYGVRVHLYQHPYSPSIWPDKWQFLATLELASIPAGRHKVVKLAWEPQESGPACFLARLESQEDPLQHDWSVKWDNNVAQRNSHLIEVVPGQEAKVEFVMRGVRADPVALDLEVDRSCFPSDGLVEVKMVRRVLEDAVLDGIGVTAENQVYATAGVWSDVGTNVLRRLSLKPSDRVRVQVRVALPPDTPLGSRHALLFTQALDHLEVGRINLEVVAAAV